MHEGIGYSWNRQVFSGELKCVATLRVRYNDSEWCIRDASAEIRNASLKRTFSVSIKEVKVN